VSKSSLGCFSAPELQKVIAGDNMRLDIGDLRRNVKYSAGYSDQHRVIRWLWDIVGNEFSVDEQKQFLKFVTSCSKPPILGFSTLEPKFTIRCVNSEKGEDRYTGFDVLKNFVGISVRENRRLPTSSTCFNLLKLPVYKSKATLREKLRYSLGTVLALSSPNFSDSTL
jgi:ubiquitin-protein ligase E3 B